MRKALIVYDLDGTLVDTREDIACSVNHMLAEMGAGPLPTAEIVRYVGRGLRQLVASSLRSRLPEEVDRAMAIYRAHYAVHMLDKSRLYPGALEALDYFKERQQAVLTNKPNPYSREILAGLGVDRYFSELIAGDSGYPAKPDPASLLALLERHRVSRDQALFVGDSPVDVETGRAAGVWTVAVTHGFAGAGELAAASPDLAVDGFPQLLEAARRNRW